MPMLTITRFFLITAFVVFATLIGVNPIYAYNDGPKLSFTFDDGNRNIYDKGMPIFEKYNLPAVLYGESGPLNSGESWVMTWDQVRDLQNNRGWEIGSHTINHPYLTQLSDEELRKELYQSKQDFATQGIDVKAFASSYGDYDDRTLTQIARYYESHRAAWGGANKWPDRYNDYKLVSREVAHNIPPEEVYGWIDQAIANNEWLILLLHDIVEGEPQPYQYNENDLESIVRYASNQAIEVTTITEGLKFSDAPNMIPNYSFEETDASGWALNWKRNNEIDLTIDANNRGNAPSATRSLKITGGSSQNTAISDMIELEGYPKYLLRMYQNVQDLTSGGWAVWVNEFDSNGVWLGGQWLGGNYGNFIGNRYYEYTPSSTDVRKIEIHVFTESASNLTLYVDSVELRGIGTPTPPKPINNLIKNPSFERTTDGWANNWTRLDDNISIDMNNNGSSPFSTNSLKIPGGANQRVTVSDAIAVDGASSYKLSFYQKLENVSAGGGSAVWVDEFDDNNVWVSGAWLGGTYSDFNGVKSMNYIPTSNDVSNIQVHFFTEAGSEGATLYLDEVILTEIQ